MSLDRRQFLVGSGCVLASAPFIDSRRVAGAESTSVAVIGAGLSGLAAAHELSQAGFSVRLFEQAKRAGGRAWTISDYFDDDVWVDAGSMGAGQSYSTWLAYCKEFGVDVAPRQPQSPRPEALTYLGGELYTGSELRADPSAWPVALSEREKSLAPFALLSAELRPVAEEIGQTANILDPVWSRYDAMSLLEFLQQRDVSPAAIELIERSLNYNSLASVSALSALRDATRLIGVPRGAVEPARGHGALPDAMAKSLGERIVYDTSLKAVRRTGTGVELGLDDRSGEQTFAADHLVLTLPFTALRDVDFEPALPHDRQRIINSLPYTQIAKTFVQTRSRFWEDAGDFSALYSDTAFERVFNLSQQMPSSRGLLVNWINGAGLDRFTEMDAADHSEAVVEWLTTVWPASDVEFEKALTVNWADTYAKGAYAHFAPGQLQHFAREIPKPIGPIHFAGEHTELVAPGLEGAMVSGQRAAKEIVAAVRDA